MHPSDLRRLATELADAFFVCAEKNDPVLVQAVGVSLNTAGVGDEGSLAHWWYPRSFCSHELGSTLAPQLEDFIETFHHGVVLSYFRVHKEGILKEQERIRASAAAHPSSLYPPDRDCSPVAWAAISTLDLGVLLTTAVDLIGERFGLDYVGIYLLDAEKRFVVLRAATGLEGSRRLAADHRLKVNGASTVSRCIVARRHVLVSSPTEEAAPSETSWIFGTHSEIALPLITRDVVIGALSA